MAINNKPSSSWANRTKAGAQAQPLSKSSNNKGTRALGVVESFKPREYSTGSFGVDVGYTIEGMKFPVREHIVLVSADGTPTKFGESTLKRRLQAFGFDSQGVNSFPIPTSPADENEAYNLAGTPVVLILKDETYMGKPKKKITAVYPQEG